MTMPTERPASDTAQPKAPMAPKPEPENPRIQAMDFAIQFATSRNTGTASTSTDIGELINYAEQISAFIAKK